jgi:hypothetical protein
LGIIVIISKRILPEWRIIRCLCLSSDLDQAFMSSKH